MKIVCFLCDFASSTLLVSLVNMYFVVCIYSVVMLLWGSVFFLRYSHFYLYSIVSFIVFSASDGPPSCAVAYIHPHVLYVWSVQRVCRLMCTPTPSFVFSLFVVCFLYISAYQVRKDKAVSTSRLGGNQG